MSYECIKLNSDVFHIEAGKARYLGGNSNVDTWTMQEDNNVIFYVCTYDPQTFLKYIIPKENKI